ncbi:XRE family transcriptional regulator [Lysinibacillus sp. NPDC096418]|uniref:XRE family transcriptional regulator n=1 Tax=Lysinibacillus sp. NPDC096418 TaxID=3364138 RepID=UPI00382C8F01
MDVGNRLRKARQKRNLTLAFVGEVLGKTEATVQRYESGNIKNLKLETIEQLAMLYDVPPAYLMGWQIEDPLSFSTSYDFIDVPVAAGLPSSVEGICEEDVQKITLPDVFMGKWANHQDIYFLKANGDSMNNIFVNGSILAVKPIELSALKNDDIVVFSNGDNEYSVKRIFIDTENAEVIFSPDSSDRSFRQYVIRLENLESSIRIHGKVVKYFTDPCF